MALSDDLVKKFWTVLQTKDPGTLFEFYFKPEADDFSADLEYKWVGSVSRKTKNGVFVKFLHERDQTTCLPAWFTDNHPRATITVLRFIGSVEDSLAPPSSTRYFDEETLKRAGRSKGAQFDKTKKSELEVHSEDEESGKEAKGGRIEQPPEQHALGSEQNETLKATPKHARRAANKDDTTLHGADASSTLKRGRSQKATADDKPLTATTKPTLKGQTPFQVDDSDEDDDLFGLKGQDDVVPPAGARDDTMLIALQQQQNNFMHLMKGFVRQMQQERGPRQPAEGQTGQFSATGPTATGAFDLESVGNLLSEQITAGAAKIQWITKDIAIPATVPEQHKLFYANIWVDRIFKDKSGLPTVIHEWDMVAEMTVNRLAKKPNEIADIMVSSMRSAFKNWLESLKQPPVTTQEWRVGFSILKALFFQMTLIHLGGENLKIVRDRMEASSNQLDYGKALKDLRRK